MKIKYTPTIESRNAFTQDFGEFAPGQSKSVAPHQADAAKKLTRSGQFTLEGGGISSEPVEPAEEIPAKAPKPKKAKAPKAPKVKKPKAKT